MTTLAGAAGVSGEADGTASAARFAVPFGVAVDTNGNVYVADYGNDTLRKVTPAGVVTTLAGLAQSPGSTDGTGRAARFSLSMAWRSMAQATSMWRTRAMTQSGKDSSHPLLSKSPPVRPMALCP